MDNEASSYISFDDYRAWPEHGSTAMARMADEGPELFRYGIMRASKDTLRKGTLFHTAVLEPAILDKMMLMPEMSYSGAKNQDAALAWAEDKFNGKANDIQRGEGGAGRIREEQRRLAKAAGVEIVSEKDRNLAISMAESAMRSTRVRQILNGAIKEASYRGGSLKTRPDATNGGVWCDAKQCAKLTSNKPESRKRAAQSVVETLNYGLLAAHSEYVMALATALPNIDAWIWIMVAPDPYLEINGVLIHRVEVFEADNVIMTNSRQQFADALGLLRQCQESGEWPGPVEPATADIISRPGWSAYED